MQSRGVEVPVSLLLDHELEESAKVIWMILRMQADSPSSRVAQLADLSGLTHPTIRKGLTRLKASGWCVAVPDTPPAASDRSLERKVTVRSDLLSDRRVGVRAKVLYGLLQLTLGIQGQSGQFTYLSLAHLAGAGQNTVKRAVRELVQAGWLRVAHQNRLAPIQFTLTYPGAVQIEIEQTRIRKRLERATYRGEALMREYLSLLVAEDQFEDDAAPGFLVNPQTGERMEFDRFYPPDVAFEFNGPKHYGPTEGFSAEEVAAQQARDLMKIGICVTRGITLVIVTADDLSLKGMQAKVGQLLPIRDLERLEPLIAILEAEARRYRQAVRDGVRPRLRRTPRHTQDD